MFQLVRVTPNEFTVYDARRGALTKDIQLAAYPAVISGDSLEDIILMLTRMKSEIQKNPVVDKSDCDIYHEELVFDGSELEYPEDTLYEDIDPEELLREIS